MGVITQSRSTSALIEKYIGTSYDHVKEVADNIEGVMNVSRVLGDGVDFVLLAEVLQNLGGSVSDLAALAQADLVAISDDLVKGNYLGNRKIDINLALNNLSETTEVTYQGATITTNDGVVLQIDFTVEDSQGAIVVQELASYTAIYNAIVAGIEQFNAQEPDEALHIVNTEMDIINSTLPNLPTMIRIRDTDGNASNIDRIQLQVYSGDAIEVNPAYFWAKTTSALQTIANRVGDIIALGNDIDSIIRLAAQKDEIEYIYQNRIQLLESSNSIYAKLDELSNIYDNMAQILASEQFSINAANAAGAADQSATEAAQQVVLA